MIGTILENDRFAMSLQPRMLLRANGAGGSQTGPPTKTNGRRVRPRHPRGGGRRFFLLSSHGEDRVGLLAEIADVIHDANCNIREMRFQTVGRIHYDCWIEVEGSASEIDALILLTNQHPLFGCVFPPQKVSDRPIINSPNTVKWMWVSCADHAGHVLVLSRVMALHRINIAFLHGRQQEAPVSGTMFEACFVLEIPSGVNLTKLMHELEDAEDEYGILVHGPHDYDGQAAVPPWVAQMRRWLLS